MGEGMEGKKRIWKGTVCMRVRVCVCVELCRGYAKADDGATPGF